MIGQREVILLGWEGCRVEEGVDGLETGGVVDSCRGLRKVADWASFPSQRERESSD